MKGLNPFGKGFRKRWRGRSVRSATGKGDTTGGFPIYGKITRKLSRRKKGWGNI